MSSFDSVIKNAYGTAFAVLNKRFKDIQLVEDALQFACIKALEKQQITNISNVKAWLIKVATNYIFDDKKKHKPDYVDSVDTTSPLETAYAYEDATLGLLFTCCHPSISQENQLTLCLKWVMGFDNTSIARALLISEKTLEQRITRTKRKLKANKIDFTLPSQPHLANRLNAVVKGLYLVFNEGYFGNSGHILLSNSLCIHAIYLTRLICRTFRGNTSSLALLSLMLFIQARAPARELAKVTLLSQQDRSKWDQSMIVEADIILQKSLKVGRPTSYHIQAAIAGLHSQALTYQDTDWQQICLLYDKLLSYEYSPAIVVNQAVALIQNNNVNRAWEKLETVADSLTQYPPYFIAKAYLFERQGKFNDAIQQLNKALVHSKSDAEQSFVQEKLAKLAKEV